jgi:general secretion pathway protein D
MKHSYASIAAIVILALLASGCGASRSYGRGQEAARGGDWDSAVEHYRQAVQSEPTNPEYRIALERAMYSASVDHLDRARLAEARGQLDEALREYRRSSEFDPSNRQIANKVLTLERSIRDQIEASKPRPTPQQMRDATRAGAAPPLFNFNTVVQPIRFQQASLRDIFSAIGEATGINVTYDSTYQDRVYTVNVADVTLEQALNQIVSANQVLFKVMNPKTIMVIPDNAAKRAQHEGSRTTSHLYGDPRNRATINQVIRHRRQQLAPASQEQDLEHDRLADA